MADLARAVAIGSAADESYRAPLHAFHTAQSEIGVFHPREEPTLYTLVMLVCDDVAPHQCEVYEQIVEGLGMHPGTAFIQAQPLVEQWRQTHPGYVVRKWRLRSGRGA